MREDSMLFENEPCFKLIQVVAGIHIKTRKFTERKLKQLNMTYPQLGALMALMRKDDITQRELAELLETDTTTAMVLCDSLEKRGWLIRTRDRNDRRVNRLILTEDGRRIYGQAMSLIETGYESVFGGTASEKLNEVLPFLEEIYNYIKHVTQKDKSRR
jgi:DNA-binding MarR family transcriptional regulator